MSVQQLDEFDHLWICAVCGERKVVPCLARDCERRHDEMAERSGQTPETDPTP